MQGIHCWWISHYVVLHSKSVNIVHFAFSIKHYGISGQFWLLFMFFTLFIQISLEDNVSMFHVCISYFVVVLVMSVFLILLWSPSCLYFLFCCGPGHVYISYFVVVLVMFVFLILLGLIRNTNMTRTTTK
jgi:hypothetical protein